MDGRSEADDRRTERADTTRCEDTALNDHIGRQGPAQRAAVVVNPAAGRGRAARALRAVPGLRAPGPSVEVLLTTRPGQAREQAARAVDLGCDTIVAAGGDGTVSEVVAALCGTPVRLGIVPLGTGNDLARHLGIPLDPAAALTVALGATSAPLDVGSANGRRFVNIVGCGFDADVSDRVNRGFRHLHGTAAYVAAVVQGLARLRHARFRLQVDDETLEIDAVLVAIANSRSYGGGMKVAPSARVDDGILDICVVGRIGPLEFARAFPRVFRGTHVTHPRITITQGHRVRVEADPPVRYLVDGDVVGSTPLDVDIERHALRVLVPEGSSDGR